jgi:hypothetical protein
MKLKLTMKIQRILHEFTCLKNSFFFRKKIMAVHEKNKLNEKQNTFYFYNY